MSNNINRYDKGIYIQVIKAYLYEAKSHLQIQEEILRVDTPARGGGFLAMEILHRFGIDGSKKGILKIKSLDEDYQNASGSYRQGLELLRK